MMRFFPFVVILLFASVFGCQILAPPVDVEKEKAAIQSVIAKETESYYRQDFEAWKNTYLQSPAFRKYGYWEGFPHKIEFNNGFKIETSKLGEKFSYLSDHKNSKLLFASVKENPRIEYSVKVKGKKLDGEVSLGEFMDVKGWKAAGNRLSDQKLLGMKELESVCSSTGLVPISRDGGGQSKDSEPPKVQSDEKLHAGNSIDFDVKGQGSLF